MNPLCNSVLFFTQRATELAQRTQRKYEKQKQAPLFCDACINNFRYCSRRFAISALYNFVILMKPIYNQHITLRTERGADNSQKYYSFHNLSYFIVIYPFNCFSSFIGKLSIYKINASRKIIYINFNRI